MQYGGWRARAATALVAVALAAGCSDDDEGAEPARASVPETTTTVSVSTTSSTAPTTEFEPLPADPDLTPEEQVEAAYLYSWEVLAAALRTPRPELLETSFDGAALELRMALVQDLMANNQVGLSDLDHDYSVAMVDEATALVTDRYLNRSVIADATTLEPVEETPNERVEQAFTLELLEGSWKVTYVTGL